MTVSDNVLKKIQEIWDSDYNHQYDGSQEFIGDYLISGFLDACVEFGYMTPEESSIIFEKIMVNEERII